MAWIATDSIGQNSGGGGGGQTLAWRTDSFEQTTDWLAGGLILALGFTPVDPDGVIVNFQNGNLLKGIDYSISGSNVTILFDYTIDPDLTGVIFQFQYPYIV